MKRHLEMARMGVPKEGTDPKKFLGFRGVGKPKREWTPSPLIIERSVRRARIAAAKAKAEKAEATR